MSFVSLGLSLPLQQAAAARNYTEPTPVQAAAIPAVLAVVAVIGIIWLIARRRG